MKQKILCVLLVCCLLLFTGCREPVPPLVNTTATGPSITAVEPTAGTTETTTAATEPEETQATEAATTSTEPQATEPTKAPTQPTDPTEPSKPEQTIPKPTEPASTEIVPPEPSTEETVPPTTVPHTTEPAHKHSYRKEIVAPTCESRGYTKYTCNCGSSYTEDYVAILGHSWSEWKVTRAPTYKEHGSQQRVCRNCSDTERQNIARLDASACTHSNIKDEVVSGTCEGEGYTHHVCTDCGHNYKDTYSEPRGHRFYVNNPDEVKEPTQEEDGYKRYFCIYCEHVETVILPKLEHIDTAMLEAYAREYAEDTFGYDGNPDCLPENEAGYFPGVTCEIKSMEEGYQYVKAAIQRQYDRDTASGRTIYREDENGRVCYRRAVNVSLEPTDDPNVFIIWVYYGGSCDPSWE